MKLINRFRQSDFLIHRRYEAFVFLIIFFGFYGYMGHVMGVTNLINTIMKTAWGLLMNTVFYLMGIIVLTSALSKLLVEFGVVRLIEYILKPFIKPLFNLPGIAALAGAMTFLSDNPAIIGLIKDKNFSHYFSKKELISLTNFGTSFGMGLIVITYMGGVGYFREALFGLAGATIGAIVSTRLKPIIPNDPKEQEKEGNESLINFKSEGSVFMRLLNSILDGGKAGVDLGLTIIPGVLIISTFIMMITFGPKNPSLGYQGLAFEGVPILPQAASYLGWLFKPLFGFDHPQLIAFPITSLGAVGAALSLVKVFIQEHIINGNAIAVFSAIGMCWSGFLSTYTAMFDALGYRQLTSKGIVAQTIGGIVAGISAHYLYLLASLCFHF
jgi:hypothetical protein